jgi:hypothetical protein
MTERKPAWKPWKSWVEEQIQDAQRGGEFDRLAGKGRPIPGIEAPYDPLWWVKKLLEREKISMLPQALEVRAKVDKMLDAVWAVRTESHVRERVGAINGEIARANRTTAAGPPTTLAPLDVEAVLTEWRRRRASRIPQAEEAR